MAQRTTVTMVDDITGQTLPEGEGETLVFGLDGFTYQIDVDRATAQDVRRQLERLVAHARRVGGKRVTPTQLTMTHEIDTNTVRRWARAKGLDVPARGRIPQSVIDAFQAAGN